MTLSAEDIFRSLPTKVTLLACDCKEPESNYFAWRKIEGVPALSLPLGSYCNLCGRLHKYTMSSPLSHKNCDSCDKTYSPDWRNDEEVIDFIRFNLCKDCSNAIQPPVHRRRPKITSNYQMS